MGSIQTQTLSDQFPLLDQRFVGVKQALVKDQNKQKVTQSYQRLVKTLQSEADLIAKNGSSMVPDIDFQEVKNNGGNLPTAFADLVRERGCLVLRNVVPEAEAEKWHQDLKAYTTKHAAVGGYPLDDPQLWTLYWTPAQVNIRSHPGVLEAMTCVSKLWHVEDPSLPIDLTTQIAYPDRFRIRYPTKSWQTDHPLPPHLDSGSIERWEDPAYRSNFSSIFTGDWSSWDGWRADNRLDAHSDLYDTNAACTCWRSLQGWLSLSQTNTGEGTLRLLPSLRASVAYTMLRPLFLNENNELDDTQPIFPGSEPGMTQFRPTEETHPHLLMEKSIVGIPPVKPGDYVFWHCDLIHCVDQSHHGKMDSSVVYNACTPLTPYNIESLARTRSDFENVAVPKDFVKASMMEGRETESAHGEDCGAKKENILGDDGLRAMGFKAFDVQQAGLSEGQRLVRQMANEKLGFA